MKTKNSSNPILISALALLFIAMVFHYGRINALPVGLMSTDNGFLFLPYVLLLTTFIPFIMILLCSLFPVLLLLELNVYSKVLSMNVHVSMRPLRLKGTRFKRKIIKTQKSFVVMRC
ncbi:MAG: hypothetical protein ACOC14_05195 [Bacillota bacterium]